MSEAKALGQMLSTDLCAVSWGQGPCPGSALCYQSFCSHLCVKHADSCFPKREQGC